MRHLQVLTTLLVLLLLATESKATCLFKNGKTEYAIIVADSASVSERTAAKELRTYLKQISGADFTLTNDLRHNGKAIYVGYNSKVRQLAGISQPAADDEGFTYRAVGDDIVIYGGSERGTMYGVFAFLENEFGVRWYTAEYTKVPKRKSWTFNKLDHSEKPTVPYRLNLYHGVYDNAAMAAHNRMNMAYLPTRSEYGDMLAGSGYHTLPILIPAKDYFSKHPEYFALRNGKRTKDGQLCLSNQKVQEEVTRRLLEYIAQHPGLVTYDVSQADNQWFCECDDCKKIEQRYGNTHSGLMIWFVNRVAERVEKVFPDAMLCTFAYRYTRQAPTGIKTHKNVIVRLCNIECCFAHPLTECEKNKAFIADMLAWNKVTDKLFIWDYVVNFKQYLAPFPNFGVLARNIQTFKENGAFALLEEGQHDGGGGEFAELRAWVLCKLMWNPYQDTDKLVAEFIKDYYGSAAKYIRQYYEMSQALVNKDSHLYINILHDNPIYTDDFIEKSDILLEKALSKCVAQEYRDRVERVQTQIMYLRCRRNPVKSKLDGTYEKLIQLIDKHKSLIREGYINDDFAKRMGYI